MIRSQTFLVSVFILFPFLISAAPADSLRERYIKRFPDYFFIWPVVKQRSTSFDIENLPNKTEKLSYKPNGNYGLGVGMYIFEIGFEVTFSIQPKASTQYLYGHSKVSDLQANILGKNWGVDLFTQNYNGFYRTDKNIAPGYAYTLVFKNLFLNSSLSIGPANHWVHYEAFFSKDLITLNSFVDFRLAVGYNSDRFFSGISFITQARNIKLEQVQFTSANSIFKVVVGYRFREFGILKKRAWDFIPIGKKKN